ncbi:MULTISPECIES: hypothetical protein [unclassified Agrococcus]|uniref:hypothetical protein n=1 Tax=unclassified Agrococcus TaxID=2615065 RepID=UPI00360C5745
MIRVLFAASVKDGKASDVYRSNTGIAIVTPRQVARGRGLGSVWFWSCTEAFEALPITVQHDVMLDVFPSVNGEFHSTAYADLEEKAARLTTEMQS